MNTEISTTSKSVVGQAGASLFLIFLGALTFLLAESWIIGLVALFGFIKALFVLSIICTSISFVIIYSYNYREVKSAQWATSKKIQAWIATKEKSLSPFTLKAARTSKILALVLSTITVGPFLTSVVIKVLGYKKWLDYGFSFLSSVLFSIVWVAIYSGGFLTLKKLFG